MSVSDQGSVEHKDVKVAINSRGCIFPTIYIEDEGKVGRILSIKTRQIRFQFSIEYR